MKATLNEDGSTSYTLTYNEKIIVWTVAAFLFGRRTGYVRGRSAMSKELDRTGRPIP